MDFLDIKVVAVFKDVLFSNISHSFMFCLLSLSLPLSLLNPRLNNCAHSKYSKPTTTLPMKSFVAEKKSIVPSFQVYWYLNIYRTKVTQLNEQLISIISANLNKLAATHWYLKFGYMLYTRIASDGSGGRNNISHTHNP